MSAFTKLLEKLNKGLKFDIPDARFELLEAEKGEPQESGGFRDVPRRKESEDRKKNEESKGREEHKKNVFERLIGRKGAKGELSRSVDKNERLFRSVFSADENTDVIFRRFETGAGLDALLIYMNGMADANIISEFVLRPLMSAGARKSLDIERLVCESVEIAETETEDKVEELVTAILGGMTVLFVDGEKKAVVLETRGFEKRAVSTVENERIVRGPQEGFTESIRTNVTLVRRIVRTRDLIVKFRSAGGENGTQLALIYRKGITNAALVSEIEGRLNSIDTNLISSSGVIEQLIEDAPLSPLPQTLATERPDRVASFLMNGAAAVIAEGSPFVIVMPATAAALLSSPEDTYMRRPLGTLMRIVRYTGVLISLFLPGYFVAVAMYHQGLLSTEALSTIIKSREMVFEPLPFEMILLLFVFQLIREAGMRVPGSVGQAIGVIGGLILGQAAVSANLASTVILIIVALSGLGNLCIPDYSTQIAASYFRLCFVIAAWIGGLLTLVGAIVIFTAYLANLKSFGVPFISPFAPKTFSKRSSILRGKIENVKRGDDYLNTSADAEIG